MNNTHKENTTQTAAFALSLLKQEVAAKPGENVLISPFSISLALGMTANGASGKTLAGMTKALEIDASPAVNNKGYAELLKQLKRANIGITLSVANAIFARAGLGFKPEFQKVNDEFFGAKIDELDFDDPATVDKINSFVSDSTEKKIEELLTEPIAADTMMFLINCVYFKGDWSTKFDKGETADLPFSTPQGACNVPTMYSNSREMAYDKNDNWQSVTLPFGSSEEVRLIVFLPREDKTISDVLTVLDENKLKGAAGNDWKREGYLWMPRLNISYENSLKDSLKALGMSDAFDDADFSGMRKTPPAIFIKDVKHKTVLKLDEEGAEAAAVTSVEVGFECVCVTPVPFFMRVNEPFVAFIVDSNTDTVLFAGVVNDPAK